MGEALSDGLCLRRGKHQLVIGLYLFTDILTDMLSLQKRPQGMMGMDCVGRISGRGGLDHVISRDAAGVCKSYALNQGLC